MTRFLLVRFLAPFAMAMLAACAGAPVEQPIVPTRQTHDGVTQLLYAPSTGKGPIVVVLSGYSGTELYEDYAVKLAREGYYVVMLDGKDILRSDSAGETNLRRAIERAQQSPHAKPGKAAVIGFSYGGGGALAFAANLPDQVSAVVAYYPYIAFVGDDPNPLAQRLRVPVLVLAGEQDHYNECCTIETARAIEAAAQARQATFTLVSYPLAEHGFTLPVMSYRADDTEDAWRRTLAWLRQYGGG